MSKARTMARQRLLQALYQWQHTGQDVNDIEVQFLTEQEMGKVEVPYFRELLHKILESVDIIDEEITSLIDRPMEQVDPVEKAILRIGTYELMHRPEIPYRVVINEGVELAKVYGADQSHKYVNGILDKIAQKLRSVEIRMKVK